MTSARFRDDGRHDFEFYGRMLLLCPRCRACAVSEPRAASTKQRTLNWSGPRRLVCLAGGLTRHWHPDRAPPRRRTVGIDPYFHLPYWLAARCRHGAVYAMNEEQLAYLESFIAAGLRERSGGMHGWANSSYVSRLPSWMKAASNRTELLRCIDQLKAKLAGR